MHAKQGNNANVLFINEPWIAAHRALRAEVGGKLCEFAAILLMIFVGCRKSIKIPPLWEFDIRRVKHTKANTYQLPSFVQLANRLGLPAFWRRNNESFQYEYHSSSRAWRERFTSVLPQPCYANLVVASTRFARFSAWRSEVSLLRHALSLGRRHSAESPLIQCT